jgi:hypothetical protein
MTHIYPARVADISLTTGLLTFSVSGVAPAVDMRTFSDVLQMGDTIYLGVAHRDKNEWEEGIYTYVGTNRFARTQILQSSNGGAPVNFSAGIKDVWATVPSLTVQRADENVTHTGVTEIDFGEWPGGTEASATVPSQFGIDADCWLTAVLLARDTDDHSADEHWIDSPTVMAGDVDVSTSSFVIYATHEDGLYGKYSVAWAWKEGI